AEQRARLEGSRSAVPWRRPDREVARRLLRSFPPGGVLHLENLGWAVYLGPTGSGPGLFWLGDRALAVPEYRQIDYIPLERPQVSLPEELLNLAAGPVELGQMLPVSVDAQAWMSTQLAGLDLPDLADWIARHQA